jgi:hypothetical protein
LPSPRQILRLWLPSPKGRGVGGEGEIYASYINSATPNYQLSTINYQLI